MQAQIVANTRLNSEDVEAGVGLVQGAFKPGAGADEDVRGVEAESVVASAASSELSGLSAALAGQVHHEYFTFPPSCIVEDENNLVHFDFFLFHRQIDDNCQLAFIDLVGFHLCREIMYFLLFSRLLTTTERSC